MLPVRTDRPVQSNALMPQRNCKLVVSWWDEGNPTQLCLPPARLHNMVEYL